MLALITISVSGLPSTLWVVQASPDTILYIEPSSIVDPTLTPGSTFTVDVVLSDVEYLYTWQFNMTFDPAVLRIANLIEGDFLKVHPEGTWFLNKTENERGWALIGCSTIGEYIGVSGSGTLVAVEFQVLAVGESLIEFQTEPIDGYQWTYLLQQLSAFPPPNFNKLYPSDDFTTQDCYFNNLAVLVSASLDVDPNALNLRSKGGWITAYIELPEGYDVNDIDVSTVRLNDAFSVDTDAPANIWDYDGDGVLDLMVKFNRTELISYLYSVLEIRLKTVALTISGQLVDGTSFEGSDVIRAILAGDVNGDELVNVIDLSMVSVGYGALKGEDAYDVDLDLNNDGIVDMKDLTAVAINLGATIPE